MPLVVGQRLKPWECCAKMFLKTDLIAKFLEKFCFPKVPLNSDGKAVVMQVEMKIKVVSQGGVLCGAC